jgi:hypothetical protein
MHFRKGSSNENIQVANIGRHEGFKRSSSLVLSCGCLVTALSCVALPCFVSFLFVLFCVALCCLVCSVLSCFVLFCLILFCLVSSCRVWSCCFRAFVFFIYFICVLVILWLNFLFSWAFVYVLPLSFSCLTLDVVKGVRINEPAMDLHTLEGLCSGSCLSSFMLVFVYLA